MLSSPSPNHFQNPQNRSRRSQYLTRRRSDSKIAPGDSKIAPGDVKIALRRSQNRSWRPQNRFPGSPGVPKTSTWISRVSKIVPAGVQKGPRGAPNMRLGRVSGAFWIHFGSILGSFWVHFDLEKWFRSVLKKK